MTVLWGWRWHNLFPSIWCLSLKKYRSFQNVPHYYKVPHHSARRLLLFYHFKAHFFRSLYGTGNKSTFYFIIKVIKISIISHEEQCQYVALRCSWPCRVVHIQWQPIIFSIHVCPDSHSSNMASVRLCVDHTYTIFISLVSFLFPPIKDNTKRSTHHCWLPDSVCHYWSIAIYNELPPFASPLCSMVSHPIVRPNPNHLPGGNELWSHQHWLGSSLTPSRPGEEGTDGKR